MNFFFFFGSFVFTYWYLIFFQVKFSFKNAVTQDLFNELAAVSSQNLDITKVSSYWQIEET
jgi:hypothetical protein